MDLFASQVRRINAGDSAEDKIQVEARGELQLGLLIEGMRRDRFEMEITAPRVLLKREGGQTMEPVEEVTCEVPSASVGVFHL
jgi:GTP-binding protein